MRRFVRLLLSVAGPGCGLCTPCEGCSKAFAADPPATQRPARPVAAVVNGEPVFVDQLDATLKARPLVAGTLPPGQRDALRRAMLDGLVEDVLLRQFVTRHCPPVDPAEIDGHLKGLAEGLAKQGKTPADYYREVGQTEAEVRRNWTAMLAFHKYAERVGTESELKAYFAANRDVFDRVQVRASVILGRVSGSATPGELVAARERLAKLKADIAAGRVTFADAARKHSLDPSAPLGGDLGLFARRDVVVDPDVARAAFAAKPGDLVGPLDTEFGPALVQVVERTAGQPATFEQVVEWVKECYADDLRGRLLVKLRKEGSVQVLLP